jgi:predicted RNase H-like HicB family nuclease
MPEEEINVTIHPAPEGGFWGEVEGMPGCITQAETNTDALARLREAHRSWLKAPEPAAPLASSAPATRPVPDTAGKAAAWLAAAGWVCTRETANHFTFVRLAPSARVTLPKAGDEILKSGYREALAKLAES